MTTIADEEAERSVQLSEAIVELLAAEPDTILALTGLGMALTWLTSTRTLTEADAVQLLEATVETAREQLASAFREESYPSPQEALN